MTHTVWLISVNERFKASNDMVNDKQLSYIFMVGKSDSKYLNKQLETEGKIEIRNRKWGIGSDLTTLNLKVVISRISWWVISSIIIKILRSNQCLVYNGLIMNVTDLIISWGKLSPTIYSQLKNYVIITSSLHH